MPTSSITKKFVIKDNSVCDTLIKVMSEKSRRRKKTSSQKYKEGKKLIAQYLDSKVNTHMEVNQNKEK